MGESQNDAIKKRLRKNYTTIASSFDPRGHIIDTLFQEGVITNNQLEDIRKIPEAKSRADALLTILNQIGHPNAHVIFKDALRKDYGWIARILENSAGEIKIWFCVIASMLSVIAAYIFGSQLSANIKKNVFVGCYWGCSPNSYGISSADLELVLQIKETNCSITGMTKLDDVIFLCCHKNSTVLYYNDSDRKFHRFQDIDEPCCDMVGFNDNKLIYMLPSCGNKKVEHIWMLNMTDGISIKKEVDGHPFSMSVGWKNEIILVMTKYGYWYLHVYNAFDFSRKEEILLTGAFPHNIIVWHAVKTSHGNFVITFGAKNEKQKTEAWHLVEISDAGLIIKNWSHSLAVKYLAITGDDEILFVDYTNKQICLIDSTFTNRTKLLPNDKFSITNPLVLRYENDLKLLTIGHQSQLCSGTGYISMFRFVP